MDTDAPLSACTFLAEKRAYRSIAVEILAQMRLLCNPIKLITSDYTNEQDLYQRAPLPPADVCVVLSHDWPTVNEDPVWQANFLSLFDRYDAVPTKEQAYFIFRKTNYLREILRTGRIALLPTFIVDDTIDLSQLSSSILSIAQSTGKYVIKECFSAGKEGVHVCSFGTEEDIIQSLTNMQQMLQQRVARFGRMCPFLTTEFIVQQYEPRFLTERETRLYFSEEKFLYAVGHVGWIDYNSWPSPVEPNLLSKELEMSRLIFEDIPFLRTYALVRFDFGPEVFTNIFIL